jgi:hypothetical protein
VRIVGVRLAIIGCAEGRAIFDEADAKLSLKGSETDGSQVGIKIGRIPSS